MGADALAINIDWNKTAYTGVQSPDKEWLLSYLRGLTSSPFPLVITMPCGEKITFDSEADIPGKSLPCLCGRSDHWFIKFTKEEN